MKIIFKNLLLIVLSWNSLDAQMSSPELDSLIQWLDVYKEKIGCENAYFNLNKPKWNALNLATDTDLEIMLNDSCSLIQFLGYRGLHRKKLKNYRSKLMTEDNLKDWQNVVKRISLFYFEEEVHFEYKSYKRGYSTFATFSNELLEELFNFDNPIIKYLVFKALIYKKSEQVKDRESKKAIIKKLCEDRRHINIGDGCVGTGGKLSGIIYFDLVRDKDPYEKKYWKTFFIKEGIPRQ